MDDGVSVAAGVVVVDEFRSSVAQVAGPQLGFALNDVK